MQKAREFRGPFSFVRTGGLLAAPQEIDSHPFENEPFRAGGVSVQTPYDFCGFAVREQVAVFVAAFAFDRLTGEVQLRHGVRCVQNAA